ncbi:MAG: MalY/PatB family protein [Salinivirgaceae bacterium]
MSFDFDEIINRKNTDCVKHDGMKLFLNAEECLPMWVADMDFKSPPCIVDAIKKRLEHEVFGYTIRTDRFYNSIVNWMQKRHGWEIKKEWISFSPGVVAGFSIAIENLTEPGDALIIQSPVYFPFFQTIISTGRKVIYNPLRLENGRMTIDFDDFKSKLTPNVKMLLLCNPHNPGGSVWKRNELEQLAEICLANNMMVISDEIHADIVFSPSKHIPFASLNNEIGEKTLTVMSHSKTFNVAGLTTSFVITQNAEMLKKFNKGLHIPHLHMGNIFGTEALIAAYEQGEPWLNELLVYLKNNIAFLDNYLKNEIPILKLIIPESTYLLWIDCRALNMNSKELNEFFIQKAKVAINEGSMFGPGGEGFIRINVGCPKAIVEKALTQIKIAVNNI